MQDEHLAGHTLVMMLRDKQDELTAAEKLTNTHRSVQHVRQTVEIIARLSRLHLTENSFRSGRTGSVSADCVFILVMSGLLGSMQTQLLSQFHPVHKTVFLNSRPPRCFTFQLQRDEGILLPALSQAIVSLNKQRVVFHITGRHAASCHIFLKDISANKQLK